MTNQMRNTLSTIMSTYNKLRKMRSPQFARRSLSAMMKAYWAMVGGRLETGRLNRAIAIFSTQEVTGKGSSEYNTTASYCNCADTKYRKAVCKHRIAYRLSVLVF